MIKNGTTVKMHYTLTVDGVILDQSPEGEPLVYLQGSGQIIPGLESQLEGLKKGDRKEVTVPPDQAYGVIDNNAFQKVAKTAFQNAPQLKVGDIVTGQLGEHQFQAVVANIGMDDITLDFNHPLAGKTLTFSIEILEVV